MNLWELHCIGKNVRLDCWWCLSGLFVVLAGLLVVLVWLAGGGNSPSVLPPVS